MQHLITLALIPILLIVWSGTSVAQTRSNETCEVCLREEDFERCEADAIAKDEKSKELVICQRNFDQESALAQKCEQDKKDTATEHGAELADRDEQIRTLLRRPTWTQLLLAGLVGVTGASCVEVARGSKTARPVCAVGASASALVAIVQWRW